MFLLIRTDKMKLYQRISVSLLAGVSYFCSGCAIIEHERSLREQERLWAAEKPKIQERMAEASSNPYDTPNIRRVRANREEAAAKLDAQSQSTTQFLGSLEEAIDAMDEELNEYEKIDPKRVAIMKKLPYYFERIGYIRDRYSGVSRSAQPSRSTVKRHLPELGRIKKELEPYKDDSRVKELYGMASHMYLYGSMFVNSK